MRPVTSEDCCDLLLELHDGTPVTVVISTVAPFGKGHWIELHGEKKSLTIGSGALRDYGKGFGVWEGMSSSTSTREIPLPAELEFEREYSDGRVAPFARLAQRFIDVIARKEGDAGPSFQDGVRAQVLLDAAVEADKARRWIDVLGP
jgi:predicted dehydrogenase